MNVAIIGTGNVGKALAQSTARAGHSVHVSGTSPEKAADAAKATGAKAAASNVEAVTAADIVIPAVWYKQVDAVLAEIGKILGEKILVDVTNPMKPDYSGLAVEGTSAAEQIQSRMPGARVVKAFNTVLAARQVDPKVDGVQLDGLLAGDDADAKAQVMDLMRSMGLRPIDVGDLSMARYLEALGFLNISLNVRYKLNWQNGWKFMGPDNV